MCCVGCGRGGEVGFDHTATRCMGLIEVDHRFSRLNGFAMVCLGIVLTQTVPCVKTYETFSVFGPRGLKRSGMLESLTGNFRTFLYVLCATF